MYQLNLTEAYCPAQTDTVYAERTIEAMLREQADARPDFMALRELLEEKLVTITINKVHPTHHTFKPYF